MLRAGRPDLAMAINTPYGDVALEGMPMVVRVERNLTDKQRAQAEKMAARAWVMTNKAVEQFYDVESKVLDIFKRLEKLGVVIDDDWFMNSMA